MGSRRPRPWRPHGWGFRRIFDTGCTACWLRREWDGSVTCVVYLAYGSGDTRDGIWTLECRPGDPILYEIYDKPHRVAWVQDVPAERRWFGGTLIDKQPMPAGPPRRSPKIRGWRSGRRQVAHSKADWLPRPYRRATKEV